MIDHLTEQTHFSFYTEEAVAGRQADRIAGSLERIREAADQLSFGLDPETSPHQLQRIKLAVECLEAELDFLAAQPR